MPTKSSRQQANRTWEPVAEITFPGAAKHPGLVNEKVRQEQSSLDNAGKRDDPRIRIKYSIRWLPKRYLHASGFEPFMPRQTKRRRMAGPQAEGCAGGRTLRF